MAAIMTLAEYGKGLDMADIRRPIIEMFTQYSDVMNVFPFEGLTGAVYLGHREASIPTVAFRGINEASTSGHGVISPFQEATYVIDHDIDVDRAIVDRHGPERRTYEQKMGITAFARLFVDTLIKGDQSTNPRVPNGLQVRATKFSRLDHNSAVAGGAVLSLANLDTALNKMKACTHILAPYAMRPLFIQAARTTALTGFVMQTWDEVGELKLSYAGKPFLWGYPYDDHAPVLAFNEVSSVAGATNVAASMYMLALGEGMLRGIQIKPLTPEEVGLLQDRKTFRTHIAWDWGIVDEHKYCLRRLDSIISGAIVA